MEAKAAKLFLKHALDNILEEFRQAMLNELEYIINSNANSEEALNLLTSMHELYLGKSLGVRYTFNLLTDNKLLEELETDIHIIISGFKVDFNIMYSKFIIRLDNIYKNN